MKLSSAPSAHPEQLALTPFDVVLLAFDYKEEEELSKECLIKICLCANCPNFQVAEGVLAAMCDGGLLEWREFRGTIYFKKSLKTKN